MSAVDEFREYVNVPDSHYLPFLTVVDKAKCALAELEAEGQRIDADWARRCQLLQDDRAKAEKRAEQAEAENERLTALRNREKP